MEVKRFQMLIKDDLLPECFKIMDTKGLAYSGKEDKLGNFKRGAGLTGSTPEKVLFIYMMKHIDAIASYVREEYTDCEKIEGRIQDVINYCFLLYGLVKEKENA